jgi:hypothetical protein
MIKNLEARKNEIALQLETTYAATPRRWWQGPEPEYQLTRDAANESRNHPQTTGEIIVRYDLKGALKGSALFLGIICIFSLGPNLLKGQISKDVVFPGIVILCLLLYPVITNLQQKPKLILNDEGIWLDSISQVVPWKYIAASYIKKVRSNDDTEYYLVLHYYLEKYNTFACTEYQLQCLDISRSDLAAEIEWRKMQRGNARLQVL